MLLKSVSVDTKKEVLKDKLIEQIQEDKEKKDVSVDETGERETKFSSFFTIFFIIAPDVVKICFLVFSLPFICNLISFLL